MLGTKTLHHKTLFTLSLEKVIHSPICMISQNMHCSGEWVQSEWRMFTSLTLMENGKKLKLLEDHREEDAIIKVGMNFLFFMLWEEKWKSINQEMCFVLIRLQMNGRNFLHLKLHLQDQCIRLPKLMFNERYYYLEDMPRWTINFWMTCIF